MQLRPHLGYLDQLQVIEKQARSREKAGEDGSGEESEEGGDVEENAEGEKKLKKPTKKAKQEDPKQARLLPSALPRSIYDLPIQCTDVVHSLQMSVKAADNIGLQNRGNGRASASLFAPLRAAEAESWVGLKHYNTEVIYMVLLLSPPICTET
jgi:hypothetical protein